MINPATGEGRTSPCPVIAAPGLSCNWQNEKLLIGTCGPYEYLHCLDLATRETASSVLRRERTWTATTARLCKKLEQDLSGELTDSPLVWQHVFEQGGKLQSVATMSDRVVIATDDGVVIYQRTGHSLDEPICLPAPIRCVAAIPGDRVAAFSQDHLWLVKPATGDAYVAMGNQLFHWDHLADLSGHS